MAYHLPQTLACFSCLTTKPLRELDPFAYFDLDPFSLLLFAWSNTGVQY